MTAATLTHKRGDTFSYTGTVVLPAGTWTAACQLRQDAKIDKDPPAGTITVTLGNAGVSNGTTPLSILLFAQHSETQTWPAALLDCDVQFKDNSGIPIVDSTVTFTVLVVKDVTRP